MRTRQPEYLLADLLEQPALSLAIERQGFDRRSLELVLRGETCGCHRPVHLSNTKPIDEFIAE
jgi:hypothetical protein